MNQKEVRQNEQKMKQEWNETESDQEFPLLDNGSSQQSMHVTDNARLENRKSSSGRKIARMARILMKFGPKTSQQHKLFDEKNSNERNKQKVSEKKTK